MFLGLGRDDSLHSRLLSPHDVTERSSRSIDANEGPYLAARIRPCILLRCYACPGCSASALSLSVPRLPSLAPATTQLPRHCRATSTAPFVAQNVSNGTVVARPSPRIVKSGDLRSPGRSRRRSLRWESHALVVRHMWGVAIPCVATETGVQNVFQATGMGRRRARLLSTDKEVG